MTISSGKDLEIVKSRLHLLAEGLSPYVILVSLGFMAADLTTLTIRSYLIPDKAPGIVRQNITRVESTPKSSYQPIISRNIFNPDGTIPESLAEKNKDHLKKKDNEPVPSQLPLMLSGTIVLSNSEKSIANIEVKSKNQVIAFTPNRDIEKMATLLKVLRNKVIIRNNNNGQLEYLEIKDANKISFSSQVPAVPVSKEVKQVAPNKFVLNRGSILKHTQDFSTLLMQASTLPRRKANGDIECYVLTSFQPGSIYSELSVQQGDCIKSVNGENIDSPAKAMELYNALKNQSMIKVIVDRDGRDTELEYNIK